MSRFGSKVAGLLLCVAALTPGAGALGAPTAAASDVASGTEFWASDSPNVESGAGDVFAVVVANPGTTAATVTVSSDGESLDSAAVPAGAVHTFTYDRHIQAGTHQTTAGVYRIASDAPIVAYQFNPLHNEVTNDASLLLPTAALGTRYRAATYSEAFGYEDAFPPFVTVIATQSGDTEVTVSPSGEVADPGEAGLTRTLHRGEAFQVAGRARGDLTGSLITADKRVAVLSGNGCTRVPNDYPACDHLEEQLPPESSWGSSIPMCQAPEPDGVSERVRIMAREDGTTVAGADGIVGLPRTLDAGEFADVEAPSDAVFSADKPILVTQFLQSQNLTGGYGDPSMLVGFPASSFRREHRFLTPDTFLRDAVVITAPAGTDVRLDGTEVTGWRDMPGSTMRCATVDVGDGPHAITGSAPIGASVYGFDQYASYAYPSAAAAVAELDSTSQAARGAVVLIQGLNSHGKFFDSQPEGSGLASGDVCTAYPGDCSSAKRLIEDDGEQLAPLFMELASDQVRVLQIPTMNADPSSLSPLAADGRPRAISTTASPLKEGATLARWLRWLKQQRGIGRVVLAGHSMGGMLIRSAEQQLRAQGGGPEIAGTLTLGTPHYGAEIARNVLGSCPSVACAEIFGAVDGFDKVVDFPLGKFQEMAGTSIPTADYGWFPTDSGDFFVTTKSACARTSDCQKYFARVHGYAGRTGTFFGVQLTVGLRANRTLTEDSTVVEQAAENAIEMLFGNHPGGGGGGGGGGAWLAAGGGGARAAARALPATDQLLPTGAVSPGDVDIRVRLAGAGGALTLQESGGGAPVTAPLTAEAGGTQTTRVALTPGLWSGAATDGETAVPVSVIVLDPGVGVEDTASATPIDADGDSRVERVRINVPVRSANARTIGATLIGTDGARMQAGQADLPAGGGTVAVDVPAADLARADGSEAVARIELADEDGLPLARGGGSLTIAVDPADLDVALIDVTPIGGAYANGTAELQIDAYGSVDALEVSVDGGSTWTSVATTGATGHRSGVAEISQPDDGPHVIRARALDGGATVATGEATVVFDRVAPTLLGVDGLDPEWRSSAAQTLRFIAADDRGAVTTEVSVDGQVADRVAGDGADLTLADGTHAILLTTRDAANNASATTSGEIRIDTVAPSADVDAPAEARAGSAIVLRDRSTDATSGIATRQWVVGGQVVGTGETLRLTMPGAAVDVTLNVTDAAGNAATNVVHVALAATGGGGGNGGGGATPAPSGPTPVTGAGGTGTSGGTATPRPLGVRLSGALTKRALRHGTTALRVRLDAPGHVTVVLFAQKGKRRTTLARVAARLRAGKAKTIRIPRRTLPRGHRIGITLTARPNMPGGRAVVLRRWAS